MLDFDDEAYSIKELTGARVKRLRGYPNEFLEERGIVAPGWEPSAPSPMVTAGVVEGITVEEARRAYPDVEARFAEHPRGVLVFGGAASGVAVDLSIRRKLRSYAVYFNPEDGDFFCVVREPDGRSACFAIGKPSPNYPPLATRTTAPYDLAALTKRTADVVTSRSGDKVPDRTRQKHDREARERARVCIPAGQDRPRDDRRVNRALARVR